MITLASELKQYGAKVSAEEFNDMLQELYYAMGYVLTVDEFLCHPDEAKRFCCEVRRKVGKKLPDDMILRRLLNIRKSHDGRKPRRKAA